VSVQVTALRLLEDVVDGRRLSDGDNSGWDLVL
jgi:hypothetical protein